VDRYGGGSLKQNRLRTYDRAGKARIGHDRFCPSKNRILFELAESVKKIFKLHLIGSDSIGMRVCAPLFWL
jgi:hypothetical protein